MKQCLLKFKLNRMSKLFIIDDDPVYHTISQLIIKKNNLFETCTSYTKARPALDYLIEHKNQPEALPDLILLDLNMTEMDGWNFLCVFEDLLPFLTKQMEIFIVTSSIDPNDKLRSKAYPFVQGFISKPLTVNLLVDISNRVTTNSIIYDNLRLLGSVLTDGLAGLVTPPKEEHKKM